MRFLVDYRSMKKRFLILSLLFFSLICANAEYNRLGIPDSSSIRKKLVETWFEAPLSFVRMNGPEIMTNAIGQRFQVRLEETEDYFSILVAPHARLSVGVYSDKGNSTEIQDVYPGDAPGAWILVKDKKTEKPIKIVYYFASDSDVFVQFLPFKNSSLGDFVIFNCYAAKGVSTGLPFERYYSASFAEVVKWTEKMLPWNYTRIFPENYHSTLQMANIIRERLPEIIIEEDACYDENFEPVYISTGKKRKIDNEYKERLSVSGAGFLKWISDGIVEPLTGGYLKRDALIRETVDYKPTGFQGILSESYNIFFTLDWIRNLAAGLVSVRTGRNYFFDEAGVDVKVEPFCAEFTSQGIQNLSGFVPNAGYSTKYLKALLYVLAVTEPETFYFAAIREADRTRSPEIQVFNSAGIFFPYFDSSARFKVIMFKDGKELSFEDFWHLYENDSIFLTRSYCTEQFYPVSLKNKDF